MLKKVYDFKAEFYDIDSMGVMWHGNYVRFLEMARCRFLDDMEFNYLDMKECGFALPIIKMDFKYIRPIFFNDDFSIHVELLESETIFKLKYSFYKNKILLCRANTSQVAVNINTREVFYLLPEVFTEKINLSIKNLQ